MDGSGYFDVRDAEDRWIRIGIKPGQLIVLPEGIYHRFTNDINDYIKAMRLFVGAPVWTPFNRTDINEENPSRIKYVQTFLKPVNAVTDEESGDVKRQKIAEVEVSA